MELTGRLVGEAIQRETLIILYDKLNDKIAEMEPVWFSEDEDLWNALSFGEGSWTVEEVPLENFYPGTIPSLINAPIEFYPNVCVICYIGNPNLSQDDTGELYTNRLAVEIMVKSGPYVENDMVAKLNNERQVNSRIQKTLDAAHLTILDNRTLNNLIPDLPAPRWTIGDIFIRRNENAQGQLFCWQGGSLQYDLTKYVNLV